MQNVIVFDIDGVLCDSNKRQASISHNEMVLDYQLLKEYHSKSYDEDEVIENGLFLYLSFKNVYKILFLTARNRNLSMDKTLYWLQSNIDEDINTKQIYMGPNTDLENTNEYQDITDSTKYKRENIKLIKEQYNIVLAIDDSIDNYKMFQEEKIAALLFSDPNIKGLYK